MSSAADKLRLRKSARLAGPGLSGCAACLGRLAMVPRLLVAGLCAHAVPHARRRRDPPQPHPPADVARRHARAANRITDFVLTLLQGHPTFVFWPAHVANHHRHRHGPLDAARTYRFWGGDSNHLIGYLLHPLQAGWVLYPDLHPLAAATAPHRPRRVSLLPAAVWRLARPVDAAAGHRLAPRAALRHRAAAAWPALAAGHELPAARPCRRRRRRVVVKGSTTHAISKACSIRCCSTSACTRRTTSVHMPTGPS
jgi:hypothetical protein